MSAAPAIFHPIELWAPLVGQFLAAIPACMAAFTAWLSYRSSLRNRAELVRTNATVEHVAQKVEEVHVATNSMKDQLVAATDAAAHARGVQEATDAGIAAANAKAVAHAEGRAEGLQEAIRPAVVEAIRAAVVPPPEEEDKPREEPHAIP